MIAFAVWALFLGGLAINVHWFVRLDVTRIDFLDGILIGQAYYIIVPLSFFLVAGSASMSDLDLQYLPFYHLSTTAVLISGLYLFPALRVLFPRVQANRPDYSNPRTGSAVIGLFITTSVASFLMTGLASGGHWQANLDEAFHNPLFLPLKYAANVTRNAVFGILLYKAAQDQILRSRALWLGLCLALFDVMTTFNRITAVYLFILAMLLLKHHPVRMLVAGTLSLWLVSALSALWPVFRGLATAQGYTVASFAQAWDAARSVQNGAAQSWDGALNSVFESSNMIVLNWIVQHYGSVQQPFIPFSMLARPVTLWLPSSVWPDRPVNFGLTLGADIAQIPSLALNSTLYGESFANYGWFWPLGLSAFVLLWHGVYRLIAPNSRIIQAMGAFTAFAMWRFDASFVGCAVLLTVALLSGLWLMRSARLKPYGKFYDTPKALTR